MVAVKRSDRPTAPRLQAQTANGFSGSAVCRYPPDTTGSRSLWRIRQPLVCDKSLDSGVAIHRNGDLLLAAGLALIPVVLADPAARSKRRWPPLFYSAYFPPLPSIWWSFQPCISGLDRGKQFQMPHSLADSNSHVVVRRASTVNRSLNLDPGMFLTGWKLKCGNYSLPKDLGSIEVRQSSDHLPLQKILCIFLCAPISP